MQPQLGVGHRYHWVLVVVFLAKTQDTAHFGEFILSDESPPGARIFDSPPMMQFVTRQSRVSGQLCRGIVSRRVLSPQSNVNPARLRSLSTTTAGARQSSNGLAIALGTALVGLGLYHVGSSRGSVSTNTAVSTVPVYGTAEDFKRAIKELEASFEEGVVSTDPANLSTHGFSPNVMHKGEPFATTDVLDANSTDGRILGVAHSVVVYPSSTEDVVKVVKIANKYHMPVVPYAGGTSLEGHFIGVGPPCAL